MNKKIFHEWECLRRREERASTQRPAVGRAYSRSFTIRVVEFPLGLISLSLHAMEPGLGSGLHHLR